MRKTILFSREDILERVKALAAQISSDYSGKEPVFIGVLNGAVFFFSDLMREISIPARIDFIRAASYGSRMISGGSVRLTKDVEIPVRGKPVILVEDIVDTGLTISRIIDKMKEKNPDSIRVCAFIDKLERRENAVSIDYCGFRIEEGFIVGYGLDYDEKYRQLPDIYKLS